MSDLTKLTKAQLINLIQEKEATKSPNGEGIEKIELAERDYIINKDTEPPPTPEELIGIMNGEKPTNYYIDSSNIINSIIIVVILLPCQCSPAG